VLDAGERLDDCGPRGRAVESSAGTPRHDRGLQPAEDHRRVTVGMVDHAAHPGELEPERALENLRGRGHVRAEDLDADPAQAAKRRHAVSACQRRVNRRVPVRLDAEVRRAQAPGVTDRREDDRYL
jgi:hypothetical protein